MSDTSNIGMLQRNKMGFGTGESPVVVVVLLIGGLFDGYTLEVTWKRVSVNIIHTNETVKYTSVMVKCAFCQITITNLQSELFNNPLTVHSKFDIKCAYTDINNEYLKQTRMVDEVNPQPRINVHTSNGIDTNIYMYSYDGVSYYEMVSNTNKIKDFKRRTNTRTETRFRWIFGTGVVVVTQCIVEHR
jgi:hypothetical protein